MKDLKIMTTLEFLIVIYNLSAIYDIKAEGLLKEKEVQIIHTFRRIRKPNSPLGLFVLDLPSSLYSKEFYFSQKTFLRLSLFYFFIMRAWLIFCPRVRLKLEITFNG